MRSFTKFLLVVLFCGVSTAVFAQTTTLAGGDVSAGNISPYINNVNPAVSNPIGSFSLVQGTSGANLTQVIFTTTGTYTTTDISAFTLYVNTNANSIIGSTAVTSGSIAASGPGTQTINLSTAYSLTTSVITYYFFIVPTISTSAVNGHTIATNSISSTNVSMSAGTVTGSAAASGTLTILNHSITSTTGASRCGTGIVTLNATPSAGASMNWYNVATGGTPSGTGT